MLITVFTPTYNRANLLFRVYDSLCKQTCMDFEWIIVDDGSTDNTKDVIFNISSQHSDFPIHYIYKENGGKHTAINLGVKEAKGELFFILDSDDYLPKDALQNVALEFEKVKNDKFFAGVAGLDMFANGQTLGCGLPCDFINCNAMEIRYKYHVTGDLKEVFRTTTLQDFPFPEISGERFCPEQLIWFRIAQNYTLHYFNKPIYVADYQEKGITANITRVRMHSPIATTMCYAELTRYNVPFIQKLKAAINYWRFRFCARDKKQLPRIAMLWIIIAPFAFMMHLRDTKLLH